MSSGAMVHGHLYVLDLSSNPGKAHNLPQVPNVADIQELSTHIQACTDIFSRLLSEEKWIKRLSDEHRRLLESNVELYRAFCESTAKLLQSFSNFSQLFAKLFGSLHGAESYRNIASVARGLESKALEIATELSSIQNKQLRLFIGRFGDLMNAAPENCECPIASDARCVLNYPEDVSRRRCATGLQEVFQRLEGFWRVVATYLSSVMNSSSTPPHPNITRKAEDRWSNYSHCLEDTKDDLLKSSDALKSVSWKPGSGPGFWAKLGRLFR